MTLEINTLALKKGDLLYNPGKFGDAPGWGQIVQVKEPTGKFPKQYVVDMGQDYTSPLKRFITVPHYTLKPGVGQILITPQQYEVCRQQANDRLNEFYKLLNRKSQ